MSKSIESNPDHDNFSFVESEHDILEFWEREAIFQQSLDQTKEGGTLHFLRWSSICHGSAPSWAPGRVDLKGRRPALLHHARTLRPKALWLGLSWTPHRARNRQVAWNVLERGRRKTWRPRATTTSAAQLFLDTRKSGVKPLLVLADGSTLITITKPWNPGTWSPYGGLLRNCGTRD